MQTVLPQHRKRTLNWVKLIMLGVVALGVVFRFSHLDDRVYWHDETLTLFRAAGYTIADILNGLFQGRVLSMDDVLKFQQLTPEKTTIEMLVNSANDDQPLTPLYFLLTRFWMAGFGNDVVAIRTFSVLWSLLAFPCLYWLCLELFGSSIVGWIAVGLLSVSPFQVYYAAEARHYTVWTVFILLMHLTLLRAIRQQTWQHWALYSLVTALALYSNLVTCFVILGHGIYVFALERFRINRTTLAYVAASIAGLIAFSPWFYALFINLSKMKDATAWMTQTLPLKQLIKVWLVNFQEAFLKPALFPGRLQSAIALCTIAVVILSFYTLCRRTSSRVWLFVISAIVPLPALLMLQDLLLGGIRSTNSRYFFPCYLGIHIAVAYWLASKTTSDKAKPWQQKGWQLIAVTIFAVGILSMPVQFKQGNGSSYKAVADLINQVDSPLVISSEVAQGGGTLGDILALAHLLNREVKMQLVIDPNIPKIPQQFKTVFLYKPSPSLEQNLSKQYSLKQLHSGGLWSMVR